MTLDKNRIVSSDEDLLITVDRDDNPVGTLSKALCHDGDGILHRAFSVFLFDRDGRLLLQRRSAGKRLWPNFWSNTCCSHPRANEQTIDAAGNRLWDELHVRAALKFVYKFIYQANFANSGSEHELCHVFIGRLDDTPEPNPTEVSDIKFLSAAQLDQALAGEAANYTPWFRMEWERLNSDYREVIAPYLARD